MKRPSFQFYPKDWLSDPNVMAMSPTQRGGYIQLLCVMWGTDDCRLRNDSEFLSRISGLTSDDLRVVQGCFNQDPTDSTCLVHKRLNEERKKQDEWREKSKTGGLKSAEKRREKAKSKGGSTKGQPKGNTPSPSPSILIPPLIPPKRGSRTFKKEDFEHIQWESICHRLEELGLVNQVNPVLYMKTIDEFSARGQGVRQEVNDCIFWCKNKGLKSVTVPRIRNWLKNWAKKMKEQELKNLSNYQDKKFETEKKTTEFLKSKPPPVWTPPL